VARPDSFTVGGKPRFLIMVEILYENLTQDQVNDYTLVLNSYDLSYTVKNSSHGWEIWVESSHHEKAVDLIERYKLENPRRPAFEKTSSPQYEKTYTAVWASLALLTIYLATNHSDRAAQILSVYSASAFYIIDGEVYRTVSSLMLHAGYVHLTGNIAGIALFGTAVCTITGAGVGWLIVLLSGILGNLLNAILFQHSHHSIGASTAVFGAIGFLSSYRFCNKIIIKAQRTRAWLPLAGGLALLGFLGAGIRSDLTAHLFGFLAGIALGLMYALFLHPIIQKRHQKFYLALTIGLIGISWLWPLIT